MMQACVQKLEGKYRQVLTLAYNHGMSHAEISDHLNVPLGTVKTWVRRGLIELKNVYDEFQADGFAGASTGIGLRQKTEQPKYLA